MDWIDRWLPPDPEVRWLCAAIAAGLGLILLLGIARSFVYMAHYGFWNWLKSSFRIQDDSWWLIAVLILLAMTGAMVFLI